MSGRIDQPGYMKSDGYPQKYSPEHPGDSQLPSAQRRATAKQSSARQRERQPVPYGKPLIEAIVLQIGRVAGEHGSLAVKGSMQYPAHVRPPFTIARRVRIARLVRVLMVHAMHSHPVDGTALEGHRAADCHGIVQPLGRSKTSMGELAMITDGNADILAEEPHPEKHGDRRPTECCEHPPYGSSLHAPNHNENH